MIRAFDLFAVELPTGKRHAAMRAGVAQGKGLTLLIASDYKRLFEQYRLGQLSASELIRRKRAIPEAEEHERIGRLRLEREIVSHGNR